jgi:hypothetical protein
MRVCPLCALRTPSCVALRCFAREPRPSCFDLRRIVTRAFFAGALTEVGPNNEERDAACEVVSVIHCRLPKRTDTGRAAGRSKPKGTVTKVGEKARIAWEPFKRK